MPFMDDQQYMDDLFGDTDPVQHVVHVPSNPAIKGVSKRLEELYTSGCCQKIAWSKTGVVASISPDSRTLYVQAFRRSIRSGQWSLTHKSPINLPTVTGEPLQFTHVTWSHFGVDLVAIDKYGRLLIWGTYTGAIGRMIPMPLHIREAENASFAIIGLHWLPVLPSMKSGLIVWSASRKDDNMPPEYTYAQHTTPGPANLNEGRPAFICLTQNGVVRFFWQLDGPWREYTVELGSFMQSGQAFTHASFCYETDRTLILVAHTNVGALYVYRIELAWRPLPHDKDKEKPRQVAAFRHQQILVKDKFGPGHIGDSTTTENIDSPYRLTHLEILQPTTSRGIPVSLPMTILAGYSVSAPNLGLDLDHLEQSANGSTTYTMLVTWELQRNQAALSSGFDKMSSKSKNISTAQTREAKTLVRQRTVTMPGLVLSWEVLRHNTMVAFTMGDGSIDFRDRENLELPIPMLSDPYAIITSLPSAGFGFAAPQPNAQTVLSPNACMAASMDYRGKITLGKMAHLLSAPDSTALPPTAIVSLIIHFGSATSAGWQVTDDILSMLQSIFSKESRYQYLEQSYDALKNSLDFTTTTMTQHAPPQLFQSPTVHRLWALQAILGSHAKGERDLSGRMAWTVLHMRSMLLGFLRTFREQKDLTPEIARSLLGPVIYIQDVVTLIFDELIDVWMKTKDIADNLAALKTKFTEEPPIWLTLMLSPGPRHLLRLLYRQLLLSDSGVRSIVKKTNPKNQDHMTAFSVFGLTLQNCPIKPKTLDTFTTELEHALRMDSYDAAGVTPRQRAEHEKRMFVRGEIPDVLYPAVQKLLKEIVPRKLQEIDDMYAVRNRDYRQLGLTPDQRTAQWQETHIMDIMRKAEIPKGVACRRCTRCGCRIEDEFNQEIEARWLVEARRQCICGGPWFVEGMGKGEEIGEKKVEE